MVAALASSHDNTETTMLLLVGEMSYLGMLWYKGGRMGGGLYRGASALPNS